MGKRGKVEIKGVEIGILLNEVALVVNLFLQLPDNAAQDRKGGYFSILDRMNNLFLIIAKIGEPKIDSAKKYFEFSPEKAIRLHVLIEDLSSFQSRDPDNGKWGGAIKTPEFILSFSGLPELGDEAVMLLTAYNFNWINYDQMMKIAEISKNPFVGPLYKKFW